jgi:hypothetical protein
MRGSQTVDVSGSYQMQGLIVGNVTVIVWLLWVVVAQMISL